MNHVAKFGRMLLPAAALAAVLLVCEAASACPTCKAALSSHEGKGDMVGGYFWSILFMMAMPFTILGSLSGLFYYEVRKARKKQSQGDENEAS